MQFLRRSEGQSSAKRQDRGISKRMGQARKEEERRGADCAHVREICVRKGKPLKVICSDGTRCQGPCERWSRRDVDFIEALKCSLQ